MEVQEVQLMTTVLSEDSVAEVLPGKLDSAEVAEEEVSPVEEPVR